MLRRIREYKPAWLAAVIVVLVGCGAAAAADNGLSDIDDLANDYTPNIPCLQEGASFPDCSTDARNWERQYNLFENPATILWCTVAFSNPSLKSVTFPVAHKLTSSSVSFWPSSRAVSDGDDSEDEEYTPERRSGDAMYHGSPPPYRFGFSPGGRYVDIFNIESVCTDTPMTWQKQTTSIAISADAALNEADAAAQDALGKGDGAGAEQILKDAIK